MERLKLDIQRFAGPTNINLGPNGNMFGHIRWDSTVQGSTTEEKARLNKSKVNGYLYVTRTDGLTTWGTFTGNININGTNQNFSVDLEVGNSWVFVGQLTDVEVPHNADGSKSITISGSVTGPTGTTWEGRTVSGSSTAVLDKIPRYATSVQSLRSKTETSITMNWSSDNTCDYIWYTINGTVQNPTWVAVGSVNASSGSYTISNLSVDTPYNIKTRLRRKDSQLTKDSDNLPVRTHPYPYAETLPAFTIGGNPTIGIKNPLNRTFSITVYGADNSVIYTGSNKTGTSINNILNGETEINKLYQSIPNAKNGKYKVKIDTTLPSSTTIQSTNLYSVDETTNKPVFNDFTYEDINPTTLALTGDSSIVVQNYSNIQATISVANKATAQHYATMDHYDLIIQGNPTQSASYSDSENVTIVVNNANSGSIKVNAIDSRKIPKEVSKTAILKAYTTIQKNEINVERAGNVGTGVTLTYNGTLWGQSFGQVTNTAKSARYRFKKTNEDWPQTWNGTTTITPTTDGSNYSFEGGIAGDLGNTGFSAEYSFNIEVEVFDELSSTTFSFVLGTGVPHIAVADDGIAIKQPYDDNLGGALQVNGDLECTSFQGRPWNFSAENTTDTWVPVASGGEWKHRAIPSAFNSLNKHLYHRGDVPSNWNSALTHGMYRVGGTYTNAPSTGNIYGILVVYESRGLTWVYSDSSSWIWQIFYDTSGNIYRRQGINSATMSTWVKDGATTLWTNSNVGNQFAAQTINISNLSNYKYIDIIYYPYYPGNSQIVKVERHYYDTTRKMGVISDGFRYQGTKYFGTREYTVNAGSIYFADAKNDQNNTDNNWYKPYQIIGYK